MKLKNLDSDSDNRKPTSDNEQWKKLDVSIGEGSIFRFIQSLKNYHKVSVGNNVYRLTKHDRKQTTDTTINKNPNQGDFLLQQRIIKC